MEGPKTTEIEQEKLETAVTTTKIRQGNENVQKKEKAGAPKRPGPPSAFFIFMEDFRKTYKDNFPDNKSIAVVRKAGSEKWKSMSDSEKAPYVEEAGMKKAEYELAMKNLKELNRNNDKEKPEGSEASLSEINDDSEPEAS